jgi:outer membrane protein
VNYAEIVPLMPEYKLMQDSLQKEQAMYEEQIQTDQEEFNKKYAEFNEKQATLAESIKTRRLQDLQDMQGRLQTFVQQAQKNLEELNKALMDSLIEKVNKAVEEVGTMNHFDYILDASALHYISPQSTNATPLVKTKLGIK